MQAKYNKADYIIKKINSWINDELKIKGLTDYSWDYIKNITEKELKINWAKLINALHFKE